MSRLVLPARTALSIAAALTFAPLAHAADAATADQQRIQALEQRLLVLERKQEIQQEEASTKAQETPVVSASEKGFGLKSASGDYSINFKLLAQADGRFYLGGAPTAVGATGSSRDTFLFRRIEPTFDGTLGKLVGYRLTLRLDGDRNADTATPSGALVQDVYVDLKFHPLATVRVGKWKEPLSLENLQGSGNLAFAERGYPTALTGNRDLGVAVLGAAFENRLNYQLGIFNGAADGQDAPQNDSDGRKEIVGRVFAEPFKNDYGALKGLGVGIAGSIGTKKTTTVKPIPVVPAYNSPGQVKFFSYRSTVALNGEQTRLMPQAYYYRNQFGLLAEYASSRQDFINGSNARAIENKAWELTSTYVLTGEDASYGGVKPRQPFKPGNAGWGAVELAARYGVLSIDKDAFTGAGTTSLADPNASARRASSYGVGVNWYLTQNVKLVSDFDFTHFNGGAAGGQNRADERALFTRAQLSF